MGAAGVLLPKSEDHTEAEAVGVLEEEEEWSTGHLSADAAEEEANDEWSTGHWSEEVAGGRVAASAVLGLDLPPNHDDQEEPDAGLEVDE